MGALKVQRDTLVADLAPLGIPVHAAWPDAVVVPCAFITPPLGGGYIVAGPQFAGTYTVSVDVVILVGHADAADAFAALEDLIELTLVNTIDWTLTGVDPPSPVTVTENGAEYLGTVVHLSKPTRI